MEAPRRIQRVKKGDAGKAKEKRNSHQGEPGASKREGNVQKEMKRI
jgi:hypothetical protein